MLIAALKHIFFLFFHIKVYKNVSIKEIKICRYLPTYIFFTDFSTNASSVEYQIATGLSHSRSESD